jgi:ribosome-binding protein aMBF1 (putative translation factor)
MKLAGQCDLCGHEVRGNGALCRPCAEAIGRLIESTKLQAASNKLRAASNNPQATSQKPRGSGSSERNSGL